MPEDPEDEAAEISMTLRERMEIFIARVREIVKSWDGLDRDGSGLADEEQNAPLGGLTMMDEDKEEDDKGEEEIPEEEGEGEEDTWMMDEAESSDS